VRRGFVGSGTRHGRDPGVFSVCGHWSSVTRYSANGATIACLTTQENGHDAPPSEGTVTVTESGSGTYTQQIAAGHHRLVADEPQPIGADAGPTPYDLLLAALGACTSMTVRMYGKPQGLVPRTRSSDVAPLAHSRARLRRLRNQ
jgi:OsmC-like protein